MLQARLSLFGEEVAHESNGDSVNRSTKMAIGGGDGKILPHFQY